jgi:thiamine-phosphate pyrophosphorylase
VSFAFPKVYPLTDARLTGLSNAEQIRRLAAGGASLIQLREKGLTAKEFFNEAASALKTARELNVRLVINDRVDIALTLRADGVHLGQDDLPPAQARKLLGDEAIIGYSTHNLTQALEARALPLNYIAVGPIFSTKTKTDTSPVVGIEGLRAIRDAVGAIPLVAIGGITEQNAAAVLEAGADSVAIIGALLSIPAEIKTRTAALLNALPLLEDRGAAFGSIRDRLTSLPQRADDDLFLSPQRQRQRVQPVDQSAESLNGFFRHRLPPSLARSRSAP